MALAEPVPQTNLPERGVTDWHEAACGQRRAEVLGSGEQSPGL